MSGNPNRDGVKALKAAADEKLAELAEAQIGTEIMREYKIDTCMDTPEMVEKYCDLRDALKAARLELWKVKHAP